MKKKMRLLRVPSEKDLENAGGAEHCHVMQDFSQLEISPFVVEVDDEGDVVDFNGWKISKDVDWFVLED